MGYAELYQSNTDMISSTGCLAGTALDDNLWVECTCLCSYHTCICVGVSIVVETREGGEEGRQSADR